MNFNQYYLSFKLGSDLDTSELYLHSYSHHPEDDHMSGQNMFMTTLQ